MQHVENDLDTTIEKLSQTNQKYDEKDKLYQLAEGETCKRRCSMLRTTWTRLSKSYPRPTRSTTRRISSTSWQRARLAKEDAAC